MDVGLETCGFDGSVLSGQNCSQGISAFSVFCPVFWVQFPGEDPPFYFIMVSYAFFNCFPEELVFKIFEHILNKALNNRMVDPGGSCIDGTHIKANANKKKSKRNR